MKDTFSVKAIAVEKQFKKTILRIDEYSGDTQLFLNSKAILLEKHDIKDLIEKLLYCL